MMMWRWQMVALYLVLTWVLCGSARAQLLYGYSFREEDDPSLFDPPSDPSPGVGAGDDEGPYFGYADPETGGSEPAVLTVDDDASPLEDQAVEAWDEALGADWRSEGQGDLVFSEEDQGLDKEEGGYEEEDLSLRWTPPVPDQHEDLPEAGWEADVATTTSPAPESPVASQSGNSSAEGAAATDAFVRDSYQKDPSEESDPPQPAARARPARRPEIACGKKSMMIKFSLALYSRIFLQRAKMALLPVARLPKFCKHRVIQSQSRLLLVASYDGCYVWDWTKQNQRFMALTIQYYDKLLGRQVVATVSCPVDAPLDTQPSGGLSISCSDVCMTVQLPPGPLAEVHILDSSKTLVPVLQTPRTCGYSLVKGEGKNILTIPYTACDVKIVGRRYTIQVAYTSGGQRAEIQVSCPYRRLKPKQGCHIPRSQQVSCGPRRMGSSQCLAKGCCVDPETAHCYYPLEECTSDRHFVFAVHRTVTVPHVDPASLVISGNKSCAPVICTPDFAVFKFPVTGCGTHAFVVGETTIYLAEVMAMARRNSLNYGVITRDSPFRLLVECRYAEGNLASTGYLVKSPYLPSAILSQGVFGVQLRIATDEHYSRFYPQYHRPLRLLLGSPVYLEVRLLNAPDPSLVLLVHYCIAYPRSAQAAWVLLYEGCPNPLDYGQTSTLHINDKVPLPKHHRRFEIRTFQFMERTAHRYLDEEIYFMCSTEVCSPKVRKCVEGCFDGRKIPVIPDPNLDKRCGRKPCPVNSKSSELPAQ
nr:PREDICTED: zona pellucida sperm-binding protein 1-like [Lepisosteus oculatus]